ncbi:MAG: purine-nucleoside phosphorylase [Gemmatimonadota bacterium]
MKGSAAGTDAGGTPPADPARAAADGLAERIGDLRPRLGLILGSGLGPLAGRFTDAVEVPYGKLPGWPPVGVVGHAGLVVAGRLADVPAIALKGRAHLYEGHPRELATRPVRVLARLGVRTLFLSNAAGAVNRAFLPGDLMLLSGHVDLTGDDPLEAIAEVGEGHAGESPYDEELRAVVRATAAEMSMPLREGVYAALLGPSYETPAEIRMLAGLGVDAVGMSTVPEVVVARSLGMRCFGISCLTNFAAGIADRPLDHEEVIETTERVAQRFQTLVHALVPRLPGL